MFRKPKRKRDNTGIAIAMVIFVIYMYTCSDNRPARQSTQQAQAPRSAEQQAPQAVDVYDWPPTGANLALVAPEQMTGKNFYILMDTSGSMKGDRLATAKQALERFMNQAPPDSNLGFGILGQRVAELVPLGKQNRDEIIQKVKGLQAGGSTPLGQAIQKVGLEKLSAQAQKQLGYGEYTLVILTDGEASDQDAMIHAVNSILKNTPIVIYTIGFHIDERHSLNQPGRTVYRTADDLDSLSQALGAVLAEAPSFDLSEF